MPSGELSVGSAITYWAGRDPEAIALVHEGRQITRGELDARSNRLARAYQGLGVEPGHIVTLALPNGIEFFEATVGIWKVGATPQPVSARMPPYERDAIVDLAQTPIVIGVPLGTYDRPCIPANWTGADGYSSAPVDDIVPPSIKATTSGGSTGRPKVIVSTAPGVIDPTKPMDAARGMTVEGCQLVPGPLYHNGPFGYSSHGLLLGNTIVMMSRFDAEEVLRLVEEHRVDWMPLVPTMMHRIIRLGPDVLAKYDVSSLNAIVHFGAACPAFVKQAWIDWLGPERVHEIYGGTEGQGFTWITGAEWLEHPGSVGRPIFGRFKVLDEDGEELPPGTTGEIYMLPDTGPGSTYRYIGAEPRAREGWESLGDLGHLDADGWLYLADRRVNLILSGGANVYPAEVEAVLDQHPAVLSSVVIGLPDDDMGEVVHAFVQASGVTVEALQTWVTDRLGRAKTPRSIELVDEPLVDDAGKVRRSRLREDYLRRHENHVP